MYDNMNYAELEEMARLLKTTNDFGTGGIDAVRPHIEAIEEELERRMGETAKRLLPVVVAVNVLVLATILFVAGCQLVQGVGKDITWMGKAGQHALENSKELSE